MTSALRVVRPGENGFCIQEGNMVATRAGLEVSASCPTVYVHQVMEMIRLGYVTPVAVVRDSDLFWEELKK